MYKKIMVPLDGSTLAECVLPHVDAFVTGCQVAAIVFVRVIETTPTYHSSATRAEDFAKIQENAKKIEEERKAAAAGYLEAVTRRMKTDGVKYQTEVIVGKVAESLIDYVNANEIDLILIATHGRSGISRWVRGSIADRVLRSSRVPVLMVRAAGTAGGEGV